MKATEIVKVDLCWELIYKRKQLYIKTKPHGQQIYEDLSLMKRAAIPYFEAISIDQTIQDHKHCSEKNSVLKELLPKKLC